MSRYSARDRFEGNPEAKIYVGDLSSTVTKQDLEDTFSYYGPIRTLWIARNPPGFAFIEFDDPRDAEDAVKDTEGRRHYCKRKVCGRAVRIELSNRTYGSKRGSSSSRCYNCDEKGHYSKDCRKRRSAPHRSYYARERSDSRSRRSPSYTRGKKDDRSDRSSSGDRKKPKRYRSPSESPQRRRRSPSNSPKYKRKRKSHSTSSEESR